MNSDQGITFKLELKVTRVTCGTAKKRSTTARELPGKAPFVTCDQGISRGICLAAARCRASVPDIDPALAGAWRMPS